MYPNISSPPPRLSLSLPWHRSPLLPLSLPLLSPFLPLSFCLLRSAMASPRLETFCCPNRDAATEFVVTFQPVLFSALTLGSASLSLLFATLQLLPKRKGYRRLGQYPLPRPASSSRILFIISICDILGCAGTEQTPEFFLCWEKDGCLITHEKHSCLTPLLLFVCRSKYGRRLGTYVRTFFFLLNLEFKHIFTHRSILFKLNVNTNVCWKKKTDRFLKRKVLQHLKSRKTFGLSSFCSCLI